MLKMGCKKSKIIEQNVIDKLENDLDNENEKSKIIGQNVVDTVENDFDKEKTKSKLIEQKVDDKLKNDLEMESMKSKIIEQKVDDKVENDLDKEKTKSKIIEQNAVDQLKNDLDLGSMKSKIIEQKVDDKLENVDMGISNTNVVEENAVDKLDYDLSMGNKESNIVEQNILEKLENVLKSCPSAVVENSRKDSNKDQPFCENIASNEFIKLDNLIKVDTHDTQVKKLGLDVKNFVEAVKEFITLANEYKFELRPAGSFPINAKIYEIDEFDFVLIYNFGIIDQVHKDSLRKEFSSKLQLVINMVNKCFSCENVYSLNAKYTIKKHALTILISWRCPFKCHHSISIDIAISYLSDTTFHEYLNTGRNQLPFSSSPFKCSIDETQKMYHTCCFGKLFNSDRYDTNLYDPNLFDLCDKISPNIKRCFRILKFIRDILVSNKIKDRTYFPGDINIAELEPILSSYKLKQLIFAEVQRYPSTEDWEDNKIVDRITSIFLHIQKYLTKTTPDLSYSILGGDLISLLDDDINYNSLEDLDELILWLKNGCKHNYNDNETKVQETKYLVNRIKIKHRFYDGDNFFFWEYKSSLYSSKYYCYKHLQYQKNLRENKIYTWLFEKYQNIIMNYSISIDLTFKEFKASEIKLIISFFQEKILVEEDIKYNIYKHKIEHFQRLADLYNRRIDYIASICRFHIKVPSDLKEKGYVEKETSNKDAIINLTDCFLLKLHSLLLQSKKEKFETIYKSTLEERTNNTKVHNFIFGGATWEDRVERSKLYKEIDNYFQTIQCENIEFLRRNACKLIDNQ